MNGYIGWGRKQITHEEYQKMVKRDESMRQHLLREQAQMKAERCRDCCKREGRS